MAVGWITREMSPEKGCHDENFFADTNWRKLKRQDAKGAKEIQDE